MGRGFQPVAPTPVRLPDLWGFGYPYETDRLVRPVELQRDQRRALVQERVAYLDSGERAGVADALRAAGGGDHGRPHLAVAPAVERLARKAPVPRPAHRQLVCVGLAARV